MNYGSLTTEARNPRSTHIDTMPTQDMLRLMNDENKKVPEAVDPVLPQITQAVEAIAARMKRGGRLIYIGAGTSGRLGAIDAAECPPTFGISPSLVTALIAGGPEAMMRAVEGGEDDGEAGVRELAALEPAPDDSVVGISAAGGAAYVVEAVKYARRLGCFTAGITCNAGSALEEAAEVTIAPDVGPEVLTGSTRLKAGTAQKLILNMISTGVMIRLGMVYENMMINVRPTNIKLRDRAIRILCAVSGQEYAACGKALDEADGSIRDAIAILKK